MHYQEAKTKRDWVLGLDSNKLARIDLYDAIVVVKNLNGPGQHREIDNDDMAADLESNGYSFDVMLLTLNEGNPFGPFYYSKDFFEKHNILIG